MSALFHRQLTLGQGTVAKPGLCIADYANAAGLYSSTTGISGGADYLRIGVSGIQQLQADTTGITASALAVTNLAAMGTNNRVLTWDNATKRVGTLGLPASNGLAIVGTTAGGLSWGTVTPGPHFHLMSSGEMRFNADLTPFESNLYALGSATLLWTQIYSLGLKSLLTSGEWAVYISAKEEPTVNKGDLLWRHRDSYKIAYIASPTSGGTKVLKWLGTGAIVWGDETGGDGTGIPEAPSGGLIYGRQNGAWVEVKQPTWVVSQISFNDNVVPTSASLYNLGSSTNRWGLFATTINTSGNVAIGGSLGVTGRITGNGGLTLANGISWIVPDANYRALLMNLTDGIVVQSAASDFRGWLGLGSTVTGSGTTNSLAYWTGSGSLGGSGASTAAATWNGTVFAFTANIQVIGRNISITGGDSLWVDGVKLPSLLIDTSGDYVLRSSGSGGGSSRLSWVTAPTGGGATTSVRFNNDVSGLTASPTGYQSGDVSLYLTGSPVAKAPANPNSGKALKLVGEPEQGKNVPIENMEWSNVVANVAVANAAPSLTLSINASSGNVTFTLTAGATAVPPKPGNDNIAYVMYNGQWTPLQGTGTMNVEVS